MSFTPKTGAFSGKINTVTLGTGDKAIVIGGQNVLPFYTFDAPIENAPKIGVEISDAAAEPSREIRWLTTCVAAPTTSLSTSDSVHLRPQPHRPRSR